MYKTRVEILGDFYRAAKLAAENLPDLRFVSSVSKSWNDARILLQGCKEDMDSVVIDWRKESLEKFYQDVGILWEDSNPNFLRTAPLIFSAIEECANTLEGYVAVKPEDDNLEAGFSVLNVKPGDRLVITISTESMAEYARQCEYISGSWKPLLPGVEFLFCPYYVAISSVVRMEDALPVPAKSRVADENGTHRQPYYQWHPKLDITNYELALCMPVLTGYSIQNVGERYYIEALLPKEASRHFRVAT